MKLIEVPVKVNASLRKMIPNTIAYLYGDSAIRYFRKYSLGNTSVHYVDNFDHLDVILTNSNRRIREDEIKFVCERLLPGQPICETTRFSKDEIESARHHKIRSMKDIVIIEAPNPNSGQ